MKKMIRTLFAYKLSYMARAVLKKYDPIIVMVTGSVGKTSTKDAINAVVSEKFYTRASQKSYNSEFGVPLTILGVENPWSHPGAWLKIFFEAWKLLILNNHYPKLLVLEVGADRPGDLAKILKIATPDVVVVTEFPKIPVHVEAYVTPAAVHEEEFAPAYALPPGAPLILSSEDQFAQALAKPLAAKSILVGVGEHAMVRILDESLHTEDGIPVGMSCTISAKGQSCPLIMRGSIGHPQLLAPAAGIATGLSLGLSMDECMKGAETYAPPPGRGTLLQGINGSLLIDDSYNASPVAVEEGLKSLQLLAKSLRKTRRIAVLGDMLELGRYSHEEHAKIGVLCAKQSDVLVTVGIRARTIAAAAIENKMSESVVHSFSTSEEAADFLRTYVQEKDVLLIKGSQSIRTERIVEALLLNTSDTKRLVRQDVDWKNR